MQKARDKAKRKEDNPYSNLESSEPGTSSVVRKSRKRKYVDAYRPSDFRKSKSTSSDLSSEDESHTLDQPQSNLITVSTYELEDALNQTSATGNENNLDLESETRSQEHFLEGNNFQKNTECILALIISNLTL